jgi:ribonuclease-3
MAQAPVVPLPLPTATVSDEQRMRNVEAAIGGEFRDQGLLRDALTHRSYLNETDEDRSSNERLEFLGDSVLGLIVTDYLYERFPKLTEGELTNIRSALVRTETLAGFSREINLGTNLFVGRGEELNRGRFRPSGQACAFEALLGAIYLDQGYDGARNFALRFVVPALDDVLHLRLHKNGKSTLQEIIQARSQQTPSYHVVKEVGPDHEKSFTVEVRVAGDILGRGIASSKRAAEQLAAQDALEALEVEV